MNCMMEMAAAHCMSGGKQAASLDALQLPTLGSFNGHDSPQPPPHNQRASAVSEEAAAEKQKAAGGRKRPLALAPRVAASGTTAPPGDPIARKSTRLSSNGQHDVPANYVDAKYSRIVNAPCGVRRQPYRARKHASEASSRRSDNLLINMQLPPSSTARSRALPASLAAAPLAATDDPLAHAAAENGARAARASLDAAVEQLRQRKAAQARALPIPPEALPDREEPLWLPPPRGGSIDCDGLQLAADAIRRQFRGRIPVDAIMHRLMLCDYSVDRLLAEIELERELLPQPLPRLDNATNAVMHDHMNSFRCLRKYSHRVLQHLQDRVVAEWYLGEIITYYHRIKMRSCPSRPLQACACRQYVAGDEGPLAVETVECTNCTARAWPGRLPRRLCLVCSLYEQRTGRPRPVTGRLDETHEYLVFFWKRSQQLQPPGRTLAFADVIALCAKEASDKLPFLDFDVPVLESCPLLNRKLPLAQRSLLRNFTNDEKKALFNGLVKHGLEFEQIATELSTQFDFDHFDVRAFYEKYRHHYRLDKMMKKSRAADAAGNAREEMAVKDFINLTMST